MTDEPHDDAPRPRPVSTAGRSYSERLTVPFWWYPLGLFTASLLALEFVFVLPENLALVPIVLVLGATVVIIRRFSSGRVVVENGVLTAGEHQLDLRLVDRAIPLPPDAMRRLVGRHSDPAAVTYIRSWVGSGVQLVLDPHARSDLDRVPYWVVSTRSPERLVAAIEGAIATAG